MSSFFFHKYRLIFPADFQSNNNNNNNGNNDNKFQKKKSIRVMSAYSIRVYITTTTKKMLHVYPRNSVTTGKKRREKKRIDV